MKPEEPKKKGGRPATGHVKYVEAKAGEAQGHYEIQVTSSDGSRPVLTLDPSPRYTPEKARELGLSWTEKVRARERESGKTWAQLVAERKGVAYRAAKPSGAETVEQWWDRWFKDREARGIQTRTDRGRLKVHVREHLAHRPIASVTRDELEVLVEKLDAKVRTGEIRKWKTAVHVWGLVRKMFADACGSKTRALRVRTDNPAFGVRGPDRGERTGKAYLYPSEFSALAGCDDVPMGWRRLVALAVYLYLRPGELEALEWEDVDLEHGIIHVHRATDHENGGSKSTKTGASRRIPIEPPLLPLLGAMHAEVKGKGRVVAMPYDHNLARGLRTYLSKAGVKRPELHDSTKTRKAMTFYDLRATGITWMAIRGDDPLKIMHRAGHSDFKTTQLYVREAEAIRGGFGAVFPPLPPALYETPEAPEGGGVSQGVSQKEGVVFGNTSEYASLEVPKEGLEPSHPCG
jgi:integrase